MITLMLLLFAGTIFCEFLRFWKNRKIKYPQKFLPTHRTLVNTTTTSWWFSTLDPWSFSLIVSAFSLLPSRACHHELEKVTFDYIWSWEFHEWNMKLCYQISCSGAAPCGMFDVVKSTWRLWCLDIAAAEQPQSGHCQWISKLSFYFRFATSQNLARLHEIAKISTRKIIAIPKSQNFVLANNSNNKVVSLFLVLRAHWFSAPGEKKKQALSH